MNTAHKMRTNITIGPDQLEELDRIVQETGLSRSALLRIVLAKLLRDPQKFLSLMPPDSDVITHYSAVQEPK